MAAPVRKSFSSYPAPISCSSASSSCAAAQYCGSSAPMTSAGTSSAVARVAPPGRARVAAELAGLHLDQPAQLARDADRPGERHRPQPDRLLHLVEQLQGLAARPVPLVDEREHGDAAGAADVEELERLRLEALRGVEQHHRGVDGGEHPVGVLGEVTVARGVEQVDHAVAVGELQHRRGDRDAALALHLHPVGRDAPPPGLAVHGARLVDDLGVERERLGERGLARVRVADHGERAAPRGLGRDPGLRCAVGVGPLRWAVRWGAVTLLLTSGHQLYVARTRTSAVWVRADGISRPPVSAASRTRCRSGRNARWPARSPRTSPRERLPVRASAA